MIHNPDSPSSWCFDRLLVFQSQPHQVDSTIFVTIKCHNPSQDPIKHRRIVKLDHSPVFLYTCASPPSGRQRRIVCEPTCVSTFEPRRHNSVCPTASIKTQLGLPSLSPTDTTLEQISNHSHRYHDPRNPLQFDSTGTGFTFDQFMLGQ